MCQETMIKIELDKSIAERLETVEKDIEILQEKAAVVVAPPIKRVQVDEHIQRAKGNIIRRPISILDDAPMGTPSITTMMRRKSLNVKMTTFLEKQTKCDRNSELQNVVEKVSDYFQECTQEYKASSDKPNVTFAQRVENTEHGLTLMLDLMQSSHDTVSGYM